MDNINIEVLNQTCKDIKKYWPNAKPFGSFVLGSGWGDVIKAFTIKDEISYEKITGLGKAGVVGHASKLSLAEINGKEFFIFQGRRHYYEGEGWTPVVIPAYVTKYFGGSLLFLTNAAGGISHNPGDLMIILDHINMIGSNPLAGPHNEEFGPRFADQTTVWKPELRELIKKASANTNVEVKEGTYLAFSGPTYESPAEIQFAKTIGADAVGMSTVPEAMLANAMGLKVAGISCITNHCAGISKNPLSHKEVIETLDGIMPLTTKLIPEIVKLFADNS
ncbi:MAG TPA: purine-nucleoside phosphorylase [Victivallales bacterium]|nr:purine-nucleoside phosphorylase [Victivallales bacterium]